MVKPELTGVLTVLSKDDELIAIVHNDTKTHNQVFYAVKKMGVDDIKQLLEKANNE